jgi:hypothetical protein
MTEVANTTPEPPSARRLLRSTAIAAAVAIVLLLVAVLPAEYGIDPTGAGRLLGLTPMGEIKMSLAKEAAASREAPAPRPEPPPSACPTVAASASPTSAPAASADPVKRHELRVTLAPNEGKEIKLVMQKGARASYIWSADGGGVNFDTHGETADGAPGSYHSYKKGSGKRFDEGEIVAAFDGVHGWFWRNRTHGEVTVTLKFRGDYQDIKESGSIAPTRPLDPPPGGHGHSH